MKLNPAKDMSLNSKKVAYELKLVKKALSDRAQNLTLITLKQLKM